MFNKNFVLFLLFSLFHFNEALASKLTELKVEGDYVVFKTQATKTHEMPACVVPQYKEYWNVDLTTETGRAQYSILVTAMSMKANVIVTSNHNCTNSNGIEVAKSVQITEAIKEVSTVRWAGLTPTTTGNIRGTLKSRYNALALSSPETNMDEFCNRSFPGSRLMKMEDYQHVKDQVPLAKELWMLPSDVVSKFNVSTSTIHNSYDKLVKYTSIMFESGQVISNQEIIYASSTLTNDANLLNCINFDSQNSLHKGISFNTFAHSFSLAHCSNSRHLACVY